MAKFRIKTETIKPLYAGVGATDLAVERVRDYVTVAQQRARRTEIEKRIAELQAEAKALPSKVQTIVDDNLATVNGAYDALITRGETLVTRIRKQESSKATVSSAKTTTAKAKTTRTQATKATKSTARTTAKKASTTAKKKSTAPKSSAKATTTAAKKTTSSATQAVADAAEKVGN